MLLFIAIVGGLLIMMGQHTRSESLFYYFRLEDHVPENHLLRLIDRHVSFDFVREMLRDSYSETGRPSIDPEVLLRILLIGYIYGVTSERKLVEELRMHLAWRWFTGLGFDQEIPDHSTFSKNRHGRFQESNVFQELFERIVDQCIGAGLVKAEHVAVDGSFIEADANGSTRIPHEQLAEVALVKRNVREYLADIEQENPVERCRNEQDRVSTTDPDATLYTKGDRPAHLGYLDNYLMDNESCVILGVEPTQARLSEESVAARDMITRFADRRGCFPRSVAADAGYGSGKFLTWLEQRCIVSYIPLRQHFAPKGEEPIYGIDRFTYDSGNDSYQCPEGKQLNYVGIKVASRSRIYRATPAKCRNCPQKAQCTSASFRQVIVHIDEATRARARERISGPAYRVAQRKRRKIEALFAELKNRIGMRRARLRRMKYVREQFLLAATVQNLKRLVKFLTVGPQKAAVPA